MVQVVHETSRNGVDTEILFATRDAITDQPELAEFKFWVKNKWIDAAHSQSTIREFYGAGIVDKFRSKDFVVSADEPVVLMGDDRGPSPAEFLLHALASSLTASLVYVASARGVRLTEVESTLEGDLNVQGMLGLSDESMNGYEEIRVTLNVKGDAPPETLQQIVDRAQQLSSIFGSITRGVPVRVSATFGE